MWDNEKGKIQNLEKWIKDIRSLDPQTEESIREDGYEMAERVYCLYRVSTTKQVDHDEKNQADIPM